MMLILNILAGFHQIDELKLVDYLKESHNSTLSDKSINNIVA